MEILNALVPTISVPVVAVMAAGITLTCIAIVCRMTHKTNHFIRAYYVVIASGSFGEFLAMLSGRLPTLSEIFLVSGVGLLFLFDRRSGIRARDKRCECSREAEHG